MRCFWSRPVPDCWLQSSWPVHIIAKLALGALLLVVVSFILLAHFSGASPNSTYIPAHIENGKFVPGVEKNERCARARLTRRGSAPARPRACLNCSTATARKRAWSAARCAMRCWSIPIGEIDIATTALPAEVIRRAKAAGIKSVPTGIEHGTVTLVVDGTPFEVTTLREDTETFGRKANGRVRPRLGPRCGASRLHHQRACRPASTASCTIMSVASQDIAAKRVRFIGDPGRRIAEDYLRILRFFRIHAAFGAGAAGSRRLSRLHCRARRPCGRCRRNACAWKCSS